MKKTVTVRELFFYLFFAVMFGMRMWGVYESKPLYGPLLLLGFGIWAISMLMNEHTVFEYVVCGLLMVTAGLVYVNTGEKGLLLYFALMVGMKCIDTKRLFKVGILAGLSGMICLTFLSAFGFIEDVAYVQERSRVGEVFRRSLGFPHPNTLSSSFTILAMMIMYVIGYKDKVKVWKASIVLLISALYLYLYSGSRTGIAITVGYLTINLIYMYRSKLGLVEKIGALLIIPMLWFVSIVIPAVLSYDTLMKFAAKDPTLAARWTVGNYYLTYNTVTPFGCMLNNPKLEIDVIDMSQLYLFLQLGIVAFVVISILWLALLYDEVKNQRFNELVITVSLLFMGITDSFLYNIGFKNLAFVFMGVWLFEFLKKVEIKLPEFFQRSFHFIKLGDRVIEYKVVVAADNRKAERKSFLVVCVSAVTLVVIAMFAYVKTPNPSLILADRGLGEKSFEWEGRGNTYTEEAIKELQSEGAIVLNYTDDQELMYSFYTDIEDNIEDGWFTPTAGIMEKFRKSLSIVFWGILITILLLKLRVFIRVTKI